MLLSIIIPTFQRNEKLTRLLKSIGHHNTVQVIVVDDSPFFESEKLIDTFPYIDFFRNNRKKGAGGARNTGVEAAKGKFLLFADSDDLFLDNWYNIIFPYFSQDFDIIFFKPTSFLEKDQRITGDRHKRYRKLVDLYLENSSTDILYYFYVPWSKLINTNLVKKKGIKFEEIPVSNDINFSLDIGLAQKKFTVDTRTFYSVEQGESSLTKSMNINKLTCRLDALFRFNNTLDDAHLSKNKLMMAPWLLKLIKTSFFTGVIYLIKGIRSRTPLLFDHRYKRKH